MTRRMELGDLPVSLAASLTVRNSSTAGEGSDGHSLPRWKSATMGFHDGSAAGLQKSFRCRSDVVTIRFHWGSIGCRWCGVEGGAEPVHGRRGECRLATFLDPFLAPFWAPIPRMFRETCRHCVTASESRN